MELVAYFHHFLFDETRLLMRVQTQEGKELSKPRLFVLEPRWAMLARRPSPSARSASSSGGMDGTQIVRSSSDQYLFIVGQHNLSLRSGERLSGEGVVQILQSIPRGPRRATSAQGQELTRLHTLPDSQAQTTSELWRLQRGVPAAHRRPACSMRQSGRIGLVRVME